MKNVCASSQKPKCSLLSPVVITYYIKTVQRKNANTETELGSTVMEWQLLL